jgi:predicted Rossmann fold nucleotide-binding protein DprA/Smf involved in DNA uptake
MHLTPHAQAVVLLTVAFERSDAASTGPLSKGEWARLALWLRDHGLGPDSLMRGDLPSLLAGWMDRSVSVSRIAALLDRGAALGFALEKWQRAGLWLLTRSDPDYPERLKRRLKADAPAVLFGCGNKGLLDRGGIAIIGSRDANDADLAFTAELGKSAAAQGHSIVSGGARGIDQSAMSGALDSGGTGVGVLADSLLRSATSAKYRKPLMAGDLALISAFNPEAGFNVGNAMARNRYIYCLADAAIVISSTLDEGGTWHGALENLKGAWVPLWVKHQAGGRSGNAELVRRGGNWLPDELGSLSILLDGGEARAGSEPLPTLPLPMPGGDAPAAEPETRLNESQPPERGAAAEQHRTEADAYVSFLARLHDITVDAPMTAADIAGRLDLKKTQANAWLKRGVEEGAVTKTSRPVRYQSAAAAPRQASLFGDGG